MIEVIGLAGTVVTKVLISDGVAAANRTNGETDVREVEHLNTSAMLRGSDCSRRRVTVLEARGWPANGRPSVNLAFRLTRRTDRTRSWGLPIRVRPYRVWVG